MSRLLLIIVSLLSTAICSAESLQIEPKHATFGTAVSASTVHQSYVISNRSSRTVAIREWKAISGHGTVVGLPATLKAGESSEFAVDLRLPGTLGESGFRYALFTDETDVERYRFTLSGFVYSLIAPENPLLDFGTGPVLPGAQRELVLSAREDRPLELVEVAEAPDWLDVSVDGATVKARIRKGPTLGLKSGVIRVSTNLAQQPFVEIKARAAIGGSLESSILALGFKPARVGETATGGLDIRYHGKAALDALQVELPPGWTSKRSPCVDAPTDGSACVRVTVSRTIEKSGQSAGEFRFRMPDEAELVIPFGLIGLGKNQNVRELLVSDDAAMEKPEPLDITRLEREEAPPPAAQVAKSATDPVPAEKVSRARGSGPVHLKWTARHDERLYGYMIYRSEDRAGPFRRINERPVPTRSGHPGESLQYSFTDEAVEAGKTYYYYIDSLARTGTQERLSPVLSKTVTEAD
jgi:hypothetical protein